MPSWETLVLFTAAAVVMNLSPGPSNLYVMARSVAQGPGAGMLAAAGLAVGSLVHVAAAAIGLSALFLASAEAYAALKWIGAGYLVWLGIQHWRAARRSPDPVSAVPPKPSARIFRESVLVEVLNPKTALFFLALLPQFVDPSAGPIVPQTLLLGLIVTVTALPCDALLAFASGAVARRLARSPWLAQWQERVSGTVLIGLGAWVAASERPE